MNPTVKHYLIIAGHVLFTLLRILFVITAAIFIGGLRGAAKCKMSSAQQK